MDFEKKFVHKFYDENASEFSNTRRKHWEMTKKFLDTFNNPGFVVLDAGCGNGRGFLHPNIVGLDYSLNLLRDASLVENLCLLRGDISELPFVDESFDLVLSIAVIHHLSTHERRAAALHEMKRVLKVGGKILLYVWSDIAKAKKKFLRVCDGSPKDYFATWNLRSEVKRYYYLYDMEELLHFCRESGLRVLEFESEEQSLFVILEKTDGC